MLTQVFTLALFSVLIAAQLDKLELASIEKSPFDYVNERLDAVTTDPKTGLPLSNSYEVEESEDYPEQIETAATSVLNTVAGASGIGGISGVGVGGVGVGGIGGVGGVGGVGGLTHAGLGLNTLGLGGIGLGQGVGLGLGNIGAVGGIGQGHIGLGGLINPGLGGLVGGGLGAGGIGIGNGLIYHPILGGQVGGGYVDKNAYDAAQKKGAGENVEKLEKKAEEEVKHGQEGFQHGSAAVQSEKGESGFYKDEEAKKKAAGDEKYYEGGQKFDKQGANEEQLKKAKSHKKGHVSKGFKTSSSKNEEEKTESFYDEAHDEADHKVAGHNAGSFGENAHQGFKGAHEEKVLDAAAQGKEGHHASGHKVDNQKAEKGDYLQKGYKGGAEVLEKFNNLGAHSIHGHQEASGGYQQNKGYLPIH